MDAGSIWIKLGLDSSGLKTGLEQAKSGLLGWRDQTNQSTGDMLRWGAAMGAAVAPTLAAAYAIKSLGDAAMQMQSQIDKLSVTTGMSSSELYKWSNVARYADSDISSLSVMLRKLSIGMAESGAAGDNVRGMLEGMHASIKNADGSYRSLSDVFPEVMEGLNGIGDAGTRNSVAIALFGRGYQEMAGYMLLSKEQLKGYFDSGWAPTEAQSQKLRDYEQATKDLNTTMTNLSLQGGAAFSGSLREWTSLLNDTFKDESFVMTFFDHLDNRLVQAARGLHIVGASLEIQFAQITGDYSGGTRKDQELKDWIAREQRIDSAKAAISGLSGYSVDSNGNIVMDVKKPASDFKLPEEAAKEDPNAMDAFATKGMQLDYEKMTKFTIPDQKLEVENLRKEYNLLGDKGTDAAKKIKQRISEIGLEISKNENQVAEWADKLTKAGNTVAAIGGQTYNQQFASSLQAGGVGPDLAGYSDLANMSIEDLKKAAGGDFALTGGSENMKEKAQQYLDRMNAGKGAATATPDKKTTSIADQTTIDTKKIQTELGTQAGAYTTLNDAILASWVDIEGKGLVHYTAMSEMARIEYQKLMDDWYTSAKYITETIAYNQVITVTDGVPAAVPMKFEGVAATVLKAIDLSGVKLSGAGEGGKGGTTGGINQTVNIITPKGTPAEIAAAQRTVNWQQPSRPGGSDGIILDRPERYRDPFHYGY